MGSDAELSTQNLDLNKSSKSRKSFICHYEGCLSVFNRQWKLDRHICSHTKERPYKCDHPNCSKDYTNVYALKRHISVSHKNFDTLITYIVCPYPGCLKHFQNKYGLKRHFNIKHIQKRVEYGCSNCDLRFRKRSLLLSHRKEHNEVFKYKCDKCNEVFQTNKRLMRHAKKHKEYICEYMECKQEFPNWSSLRKHYKLNHSRKLICDFCNRSYINKNTLTQHIMTHLDRTDQKVYPCPHKDCLRYYRYASNLRHHVKTAHEGMRYECTEEDCAHVFTSNQKLKEHLERHRNGTLNLPKRPPKKDRKPRKDIGVRRKSMAGKLSGIIFPPKVDKELALNAVSSDAEEDINHTINILKEAVDDADYLEVNIEEIKQDVKQLEGVV